MNLMGDMCARVCPTEDLCEQACVREIAEGRPVEIGGGMTAVDAAVQSKLLGADIVTIAYRRGRGTMSASRYEQDLAASSDVKLLFNIQPVAIHGNDASAEIELKYTQTKDGKIDKHW